MPGRISSAAGGGLTRIRARREDEGVRARWMAVSAIAAAALLAGTTPAAADEPEATSCSLDLGTGSVVCVPAGEDLNRAVLEQQHLLVVGGESGEDGGSGEGVASLRAEAAPAGVLTTYVQSQLYDDINYGGSFFQITNSSACNGSTTYTLADLGAYGWTGRVSSFKSYSSCKTALYSGTNATGSSYPYTTNAPSLGSFNDQARSARMR